MGAWAATHKALQWDVEREGFKVKYRDRWGISEGDVGECLMFKDLWEMEMGHPMMVFVGRQSWITTEYRFRQGLKHGVQVTFSEGVEIRRVLWDYGEKIP